jgi:deoxyribodipyrimidine photo-lyase
MNLVPPLRIQQLNNADINNDGHYVVYWMTANRRLRYNFALQRAVEIASELKKPLLVFEALRCDYQWASDRLHRFVLQGMADHRRVLEETSVAYYAWIEPKKKAGRGLLEAIADNACAVVSDDFPCFFLPRMMKAVAPRLNVRFEVVDSNGLLPMRSTERIFPSAHTFRRHLQKELRPYLDEFPEEDPIAAAKLPKAQVPAEILKKWPAASDELLTATPDVLSKLPIDHAVLPAVFEGGDAAASQTLDRFMRSRLSRYAEERNNAEDEAASGLSPYLHFGHISAHEIFNTIASRDGWTMDRLAEKASGSRAGWWGMSDECESFLDELITWRELGYNMCSKRDDFEQLESLPDWALKTMSEHANDPREEIYTDEEFETAATSDDIWNAAQRQLVRDGRMHNYLRMLWGKKIYQWSETPQDALRVMIHLNNKYAVDGRNPNSYSGIFWVLGRYDRAWGPERPVFGKLRYMTSDSTRRKLKLKDYLQRYSAKSQRGLFS